MALGDGIRRNLATVSKEERDRLRDAIIKLHTVKKYPGVRSDLPTGGVSYWFKQDEIHAHTHAHDMPAFVPWHRELINRFEALIREVDPELSLHYWDWTQDPQNLPDGEGGFINLFTPEFFGSPSGDAGEPWLTPGFYDPSAVNFRSNNEFDPNNNPFDPPLSITRNVSSGAPLADDSAALNASRYIDFHNEITNSHGAGHGHIGGTLGNAHTSFRDPFVFLLHANLDRVWAMWQRDPAHPERLDPAHVYDYGPGDWINPNTGLPQPPETGAGDVASGDPWWGFKSPMEPWAGPAAQNTTTGIVANAQDTRPWSSAFPAENQQVLKDSRDPSIVMPPSYDTVPHSAYTLLDRDTFSQAEVEVGATITNALYVIYDGFMPKELGQPVTAPNLVFTLNDSSGAVVTYVTASAGPAQLENPAPDMPQRIVFPIDITFTDIATAFNFTETQIIHVRATHGGWTADGSIELIKQPNPYMQDGSVSWLSTDVRVFQRRPNETLAGVTQGDPDTDSNAPYDFIQGVLNKFNDPMTPHDNTHPFLTQLTGDEDLSWLELSRTVGSVRVMNYAIAKVRYTANSVPATDVQVFFRVFNTLLSALDYNTQTNYRRGGTFPDGAPRLGVTDGEVCSIPFFASQRINSANASMDSQTDPPNKHTIDASGTETDWYFGCWLDINQSEKQFPLSPMGEGNFANPLPIPQLIRGHHSCMVAEIFFQPDGTDPIQPGATPASSDRLAQRNLAILQSGNPGNAATHTVQHTFMIRPSSGIGAGKGFGESGAVQRAAANELMINWNNLPRDSKVTLYVPEWDVDEVLRLAARRQLPNALTKVDAHTLSLTITDVGFLPIPRGAKKDYAALISLVLPPGVRNKQVFTVDVRQISGPRRKFLGAFRLTIPIVLDEVLLPNEIRRLAVLRYIAEAIPSNNRWYPIFQRYIGQIIEKVRGLGGDPYQVPASLDDPAGGSHHKPGDIDHLTGKVCRIFYDCFGEFEGFELCDCDRHANFPSREKGVEAIVRRACHDRAWLTVYFHRADRHIRDLAIECVGPRCVLPQPLRWFTCWMGRKRLLRWPSDG